MKIFKGIGLLACLALILHISMPAIEARITGTQPTVADISCWGPDGAEVCVQDGGAVIPTTDNDAALGTSALRWSDVRALDATFGDDVTVSDDLTVTGDAFKTMAATITVTAGMNISVAGACGGILRLTATTDVTTSTTDSFTAPGSGNAGCIIAVINSGGDGQISLDDNSNFDTGVGYPSSGAIKLGTSDAVLIGSLGTRWFTIGTVADN